MTMTDMAAQYAAQQIRERVLPPGYGDLMIPDDAAISPHLPKGMRDRLVAASREYDDAWNIAVANLDPKVEERVRERGYNRLQIAQEAKLEVCREIDLWLDENEAQIRLDVTEANRKDTAEALAFVSEAAVKREAVMTRRRALALLGSGHKRYTTVTPVRPEREVALLVTKLESELETREAIRWVTPAAYRDLQHGQDVLDFEGEPLTWEEADALFRCGRLRVRYGRLLGGIPS